MNSAVVQFMKRGVYRDDTSSILPEENAQGYEEVAGAKLSRS